MAAGGNPNGGGLRRAFLVLASVLGLALLGWFLWTLHWGELVELLGQMSWRWLAWACFWMLADYVFHALRWWILLRHVDPTAPFGVVLSATIIGTGMNTLLPFRAGALIRPAVVSLRQKIPYPTVLFTTLADSVCELFGLVVVAAWMVWYLPAGESGTLGHIREIGKYVAVGSVLAFGFVLLLGTRQARGVVHRLVRPIPTLLRERILGLFDQLVAGLAVVGHPGRLVAALAVTVAIWGAWCAAIMCTFWAVGLDLPVSAALLLEAVLSLEMMIPQAPGFVGGFQQVTKIALGIFETTEAQAEAVALLFWAVAFVPVTVWGVVEGWRQGFGLLTTQGEVLEKLGSTPPDAA